MMVFLERLKSDLNLAVLLKDDLSPYNDKRAVGNLYLNIERKRREIIRNSSGHFLLIDLPEGKQTITGGGYYYNEGSRTIELKQGKVYVDSVLVDAKNPVTSITLSPKPNYPSPIQHDEWDGLYFDGVNGYVDAGNASSLDLTSPFTLFGWFQTYNSAVYQSIISKDDTGMGYNMNYWLAIRNTDAVQGRYGDGTSGKEILGTTKIVKNWLYFEALVWDGSKLYIYLNGISNANPVNTSTTPITNKASVKIGKWSSIFFKGRIFEVGIIAQNLSASDIFALYEGRMIPTKFDCRLWHDYRNGNAKDLSGKDNHGTLKGGVKWI